MPKSSVEQYQQFQQYTNYIDTSDVMLGFYKNQEGSGLEKYFLMIQQWLAMQHEDPQNNHPLVIEGDGGVGKKTLLVKWFQYHQSIKPKNRRDLTILHFATTGGNNSNYFYAIYRILIKLREELNIGQKVELHEQKIRKYFSYWLDVCNQRIQNQSFQNVDTVYEKIILIFEGIDYFIDRSNGKEGNIAFWLPKYFPKNVKVIVTADGQSQSMRYFNKLNCQKVIIPSDPSLMKAMIKWQSQKQLCVQGPIKEKLLQTLSEIIKKAEATSLFVKSYLSCLLPQKIQGVDLKEESLKFLQKGVQEVDFQKLRKLQQIQSLFDYLLQFWGARLLQNEQKFKELIGILVSTQKGLTRSQIILITGISQEELQIFITLFRSFLMNFKELWMIKNDCFKKAINNKYEFHYTQLSQKIAESLKKTPNSVRKLEQQTFHLYSAGNYFKLKQVISDIQNFLLLFNPYTKYDLCKYWQKLQQKSFDPVIQYNKAIQGFQMHYHPTSDDLFRIITQISRFLKQFSDFQNFYTPSFRHPKIIGNNNELEDIGILGQFKNLQMCYDQGDQANKAHEKRFSIEENENSNENSQNQEQKKLKKKIKEMYEKIQQGKHIKKSNKIESENKQCNTSMKKFERKKKQKVLTVQQLNVEVKLNQQNFRKYYFESVKPFLQKFCLDPNKQNLNSQVEANQECQDSDREETESQNLVAKIKSIEKQKQKSKSKFEELPDLKALYTKTMVEQFQLNQKPPSNYYYKRWIWMQFPWVCMTMKCDYSDRLRKCFTSPTSYMSVSQQRQFTLQALKIALQAKRKKQSILQKTEDPIKKKSNLGQLSVGSRYVNKENDNTNAADISGMTFKSKSKKKMEQLAYTTNSFLSLNNLQKQLENMNLNLKDTCKNKTKISQSDSKNSLFITSEDKACEQYSSLLHSFNKKKKKQFVNENELTLTGKSRQEGLLPRIKQNVNQQMIGELSLLQKNNAMMRKEVDNYLYKNKTLAKKLKQLKIIHQNSNNQAKNEKKINQTKKKINQLEQKIDKVKFQYAFSLLQHERLNVLIKICQQNKTQNQEAIPDLVLECNNIKKMINLEKSLINDLNKKIQEIKKLTKKFLQNCYEKVKNETILNTQIEQTFKNRECFQQEVQKYDELILDEIEQKRRTLNERAKSIHQKNEEQKTIEKYRSTMHHHEEEENYEKIYNQIMQHLNIDNDDYKSDPKYIRLLEGLQKKKELESIIQQRKMEIEELEKKFNNDRRDLQTLAKAEEDVEEIRKKMQKIQQKYENQVQTGEAQQVLLKKLHDKRRNLKKITDVKLSCLGMLNTWYSRMGLPQQNQLVITPQFLQKLQQAKALSN